MYISPGYTGRGVGSALLAGLLAGCADAGARQVIAVIADTGATPRRHCTAGSASSRRAGCPRWAASTAGGSILSLCSET